jgi:hypothetical protein
MTDPIPEPDVFDEDANLEDIEPATEFPGDEPPTEA